MPSKATILATGLTGLVGSRLPEIFRNRYFFINLDLTTGIDVTREKDVKKAIELGADGVLLASGVVKAKNKEQVLHDLASGL